MIVIGDKMPVSNKIFHGFPRLPHELQDEIIKHAVENCIHHKTKHGFTANSELAKKTNLGLRRLVSVNHRFQSSSFLTAALEGTEWWLRATQAKSFKGLKACIPLNGRKTPVDQEIYKATASRARVSYDVKGSHAEHDTFSEKLLKDATAQQPEIIPEILSDLSSKRAMNERLSFPSLSVAMELMNSETCNNDYEALNSVAHLIISRPYEEQEPHWDNLLPKICSYDKKNGSCVSLMMASGLDRIPREKKAERLSKIFDQLFNDRRRMTPQWRDQFMHRIEDLHADDRPASCQKLLGMTVPRWENELMISRDRNSRENYHLNIMNDQLWQNMSALANFNIQ